MKLDTNVRPATLAAVLGGIAAVWLTISMAVLSPRTALQNELRSLRKRSDELVQQDAKVAQMRKKWRMLAAATLPREEAANQISAMITELLDRYELGQRTVQPRMGKPIPKTKISVVSCSVNAQGPLDRVVGFLHDLYQEPLLKKLPTLTLTPRDSTGGGADVKLVMEFETLVFSPEKKLVPDSPCMKLDEMGELRPIQPLEFASADYGQIAERNVFAAYEDPPQSRITIKNDDRLAISVLIASTWRGAPLTTETLEIPPKESKESPPIGGDHINVTATYNDKVTERTQFTDPRRFDPTERRLSWTVKSHTPPQPEYVEVSVQNSDVAPIAVEAQMLDSDGKPVSLAAVTVAAGRTQKLEKRKTQQMTLTAKYEGGGTYPSEAYKPSATMYTFRVPAKQVTPPVEPPPPDLVAADPNLRVTGGWPPLEMIATDDTKKERRIEYTVEGSEKVDSGDLIYFHPAGGIVKMPTGVYFLYPLGFKFTERILLEGVREEEDLPAAIELLEESDRLSLSSVSAPATPTPTPPARATPAAPTKGRPFTPGQPPRFDTKAGARLGEKK